MNDNILEKIEDLKSKVKKSELDKANLEGQKKSILKTLKDDYQIDKIEDANKLLKELKEEKEILSDSFQKNLDKLENDFEWS